MASYEGIKPVLEPPENRIGLGFLAVGYGVVLGAVFEQVLNPYNDIRGPGWSQLALATAAIVVSWIGLFNNRSTYPNWRARFVNVPLVQFLISVAILVGYWGLVATAEGIPGTANANSKPGIVAEALLIFLIFASYLLWDVLEWRVLSSRKYEEALAEQDSDLRGRLDDLTSRAVAFLAVTAAFTVVFAVVYLVADCANHALPAGNVERLDAAGIAFLFAYRMIHERFAGNDAPRKRVSTAGGWSTLSNGAELASIAQLAGRGEIVGSYVDGDGVRQGFVVSADAPPTMRP